MFVLLRQIAKGWKSRQSPLPKIATVTIFNIHDKNVSA